jgi:pimeloyl-ACP methyl ester carboxylesterase
MSPILIGALAAFGLFILFYGYFLLLLLRYPDPVHADEVHTIPTEDVWQIRLCRRRPRGGKGEPILFCHSLSSNHLNFEIPRGESIVDVLSEAGYDCWTIDTRACRSAIPPRGTRKLSATLDDVLLKDLPAAVAFIKGKSGFDRVHWVGHSLGGMLLYAYVLKFGPDDIASAVTFGAPPGFKHTRLPSRKLLTTVAPFTYGLMLFFFRGLVPLATVIHPKTDLIPINWDNAHPKLTNAELFYAVEMPMPRIGGELSDWASKGVWRMCADTLDVQERLPELEVPLFAIFGGSDPLIPQEAAETFFKSLRTKDKTMAVLSKHNGYSANYSHIELVFALNGREEVFEPVLVWIQAHPIKARHNRVPATPARKSTAARKSAAAPKTSAVKKAQAKSKVMPSPKAKPKAKAKPASAAKKKAATRPVVAKTKPKKKPAAKKRA